MRHTPNWDKWRLIPAVTLMEAVALSLNIDPADIRQMGDAAIRANREWRDYRERMKIVRANCGRGKRFTYPRTAYGAFGESTISLKEFVTWVRSETKWDIPPELAEIATGMSSEQLSTRIVELELEVSKLRDELDQKWSFDEADQHYPRELDLALQAWRAVSNKKPPEVGTVKQRLARWITRYPNVKLTNQTIKRIATVANWEKGPGRKSIKK